MKWIAPFLFITISSIVTTGICFWISEKLLFDQVLYQHSWLHGYTFNYAWDIDAIARSGILKQFIVKQRNHDLIELYWQRTNPTYTLACANPKKPPKHQLFTTTRPLKIAIIGDSNAYGMGVMPQQRLGEKLEKKLNAFFPTKILTLAEPGNSIEDYLALYQLAQDYFNPDLFLISMVDNDFLFNKDFRYEDASRNMRSLHEGCGTPKFALNYLRHSWKNDLLLNYPLTINNSNNYCFADKLVSMIAPEKTLFFRYASAPSTKNCERAGSEEDCLNGAIMASYTELVSKYGIETIMSPTFSQPFDVSVLEGHPSVKYQEELADHLARILLHKLN